MFPSGTDTYMIQLLETPKFLLPKDSSQLSTVNISIHISHNAQKVVVTNHILFYHGEDSSHMTRFFPQHSTLQMDWSKSTYFITKTSEC